MCIVLKMSKHFKTFGQENLIWNGRKDTETQRSDKGNN